MIKCQRIRASLDYLIQNCNRRNLADRSYGHLNDSYVIVIDHWKWEVPNNKCKFAAILKY
jgi:hypothetical protein